MDPQKFHQIDEDLTSSDVAQLKFLCMDLIPKKRLESVTDAKDLFKRLDEQTLLDDHLLIPELLSTIGRLDLLLDKLEMSKEQVELQRDASSRGVPAYRKMLLSLSEDMTEENLRSVKFLVALPKAKIEKCATLLDVMIEMEKLQKLGKGNLNELYNILYKCDKQLACRVEEYVAREQGGRLHLILPVVLPDSGEYYDLHQRPLGYCLIINNFNFEESSKLSNRKGTHKDKDDLSRVFRKMSFEVNVWNDLTALKMKEGIMDFAKKDHTPMGAFVCCVLSHGEKGTVFGVDGEGVEIRDLTGPIGECRTLASKPKLFFIQACQGKVGQNGVLTSDAPGNATEDSQYEEDAYNPSARYIPIEADMLIGMATVESYHSYRHTINGSIYIQELCNQLEKCCPRKEDILSILTKVNHEVSLKMLRGCKQMPEPRYTLTKKLVLPWTEASD